MIEVREEDGNLTVLVGSEEAEVLDAGENYILAECSLSDLVNERSEAFPRGLRLEIHSENGFGTYFFYELHLSGAPSGVVLAFRCHTPNKYWEGQFSPHIPSSIPRVPSLASFG